jgi:hypothetical protein
MGVTFSDRPPAPAPRYVFRVAFTRPKTLPNRAFELLGTQRLPLVANTAQKTQNQAGLPYR